MKIQIANEFLQSAVHRISGVIQERTMSHVYLSVEEGKLKVVASDLVFVVETFYECEVLSSGSCFISAKNLSEIVRELPSGLVKLELSEQDQNLRIIAGSRDEFKMKIPTLEPQELGYLAKIDMPNQVLFPANQLSYMITQVEFSILNNSSRNFGVVGYLHLTKQNNLRLVGSDGYRLSYCEVANQGITRSFLKEGICLSKRALIEISRLTQEGFGQVTLALSNDMTTLLVSVPDYQIFIRLSSVSYPPYEKVVPQKVNSGILLERAHFVGVIRRILLGVDHLNMVEMKIENEQMTLISKGSGQKADCNEYLTISSPLKETATLTINGRFLLDILNAIKSESVRLFVSDSVTSILVVPEDEPSNCQSLHVLVPTEDSQQSAT